MMIFLTILKIIGIVLCVILGIIAVILFVPICYELDADIDQKEFKARVHWLGRLVRFEFRWKEKAHAVLKILWFVIDFTDSEAVAARKAKKEEKARKKQLKQQKKEAKEREKQARQNEKEKQQDAADRDARAQQREEFRRQQGEAEKTECRDISEKSDCSKMKVENTDASVKNVSEKVTMIQEVSVPGVSDNLENLSENQTEQEIVQQKKNTASSDQQKAQQEEKYSAGIDEEEKQSVLDKLKSAQGKANSIKDKVKSGIAVIQFLREQELIPAIWVKLKVFLLHIRPRVLQGHLKFGLSNPADTGQVLGGIAMVPFLYQTELQIEPDFEAEDNYIQGQVYSRGHMCCIHLVILIIRLLKDKKIRSVIHTIRENK